MYMPQIIADLYRGNCEGPVWDDRTSQLNFVAIPEGEVHVMDHPDKLRTYSLGRKCGAVLTTKSHRLLVALSDGLFFLDTNSGSLARIADPEENLPGNRFNDCKCDPFGRLFAGTMADNGEKGRGALYRLDPDGSITRILDGVSISNGLDWSPDGKTMYYIDTPTRLVEAFDYDGEHGTLSNRRTIAEIPAGEGLPDGMTVDAAGGLWVALWGGWGLIRIAPDGKILEKILLPAERVSSCCFGGEQMTDLFVTTARPAKADPAQLHAGGVFRIHTSVKGKPSVPFDDTHMRG